MDVCATHVAQFEVFFTRQQQLAIIYDFTFSTSNYSFQMPTYDLRTTRACVDIFIIFRLRVGTTTSISIRHYECVLAFNVGTRYIPTTQSRNIIRYNTSRYGRIDRKRNSVMPSSFVVSSSHRATRWYANKLDLSVNVGRQQIHTSRQVHMYYRQVLDSYIMYPPLTQVICRY